MPTEREMKTIQEDRLYDIFLLMQMLSEEKEYDVNGILHMISEKAQSGMTADEIDAVRERVSRTIKLLKSNRH